MNAPSPVTQLVAVGSSAGGIEALSALVAGLPANFPAPLVIAQHLDPNRPSHLEGILARRGPLPVRTVHGHEKLEAGVIYVVPSNQHIVISDHHLEITKDGNARSKPSIDLLFQSAAKVFGEGLIAVVLSGLGSDGAIGARRVKEAGGTVVIQNPRTASYPAMPEALTPTLVDVVADADNMGSVLYDLLTGIYTPAGPRDDRQLRTFLTEVHDRTGIDFTRYKPATIRRRLERRMVATDMRTLSDYQDFLERRPDEFDRLINAFLIKVTEFFRDPALFAYLRSTVIPHLITQARNHGNALRLWSAGCATGEEAYSLALLVAEALGDELDRFSVRIFATDLDGEAIEFARRAIYPAEALANVPTDLVTRFCTIRNGKCELAKIVRGLVVFGEHDLGRRPPFPRIDLCLCRNVLIYFSAELQQRVLALFAFALRHDAYLVLGAAESTAPLPNYFVTENNSLKVYRRRGDRMLLPLPQEPSIPRQLPKEHSTLASTNLQAARIRRETRREQPQPNDAEELLLRLPIGIAVVDQHYDIRHINSVARNLLGIHVAAVGEDIVHLTREVPSNRLRTAIDAALHGEEYTLEEVPISLATAGETRYIGISCLPDPAAMTDSAEPRALLLITDVTTVVTARRRGEASADEAGRAAATMEAIAAVNQSLLAANEQLTNANAQLRRLGEEQVVGTEELQAASEELETLNEELQATNEELETLNEEQQATVEELETTNEELRVRSLEMRELTDSVEAQRQRLATVLDAMGDAVNAVVALDSAGRVVFSNALFDRTFGPHGLGFTPDDSEGNPLPAAERPIARLLRGDAFRVEFTFSGLDGTRRWYEATGRPSDDDPRSRDAVLVIRDITDHTLRLLQDQFLALAAHELRSPLTTVLGSMELLMRRVRAGMGPERLGEPAAMALDAGLSLKRLIDDLVDVGRLTNGKLRLVTEPTNPAALVREVVEMMQGSRGQNSLLLETADESLTVLGDETRLRQVVVNLLNNAFTHAPGSAVTVRAERIDGMAEIRVTDQGSGIVPEALPHLFNRFYQATDRDPHQATGLGLGLYIVREIVEAHGGDISVKSAVGEGAAFTIRLPLLKDAALAGE